MEALAPRDPVKMLPQGEEKWSQSHTKPDAPFPEPSGYGSHLDQSAQP